MQPYFGRVFEKMRIVLKKKQYYAQILKIKCCNSLKFMYNDTCCGMIAVKREVAGSQKWQSGFPWSECQVRKLTTSHCTKYGVCQRAETTCESRTHTGECTVTACRT